MPLVRLVVNGYEELKTAVSKASTRQVFILFTGSKVDGKSWCPDCVTAEPVIEKVLEDEDAKALDATFITCFVGLRDYWKNQSNPFRTDAAFAVRCIPTLIDAKNKAKRLSEEQLMKPELIQELLDL